MSVLAAWRAHRAARKARHKARHLAGQARWCLKRQGKKVPAEVRGRVEAALGELNAALDRRAGVDELGPLCERLDPLLTAHFVRKSHTREYFESIGGAIAVALVIRAFVIEAFKIPSGSMIPTLLVGDHIFVNKYVYGLRVPFTYARWQISEPERGDVVVFINPREPDKDFIKRVAGVPGDTVELRGDVLYINGEPQPREYAGSYRFLDGPDPTGAPARVTLELYKERLGGVEHAVLQDSYPRDEGPWRVEPGHVFVMGDNRDNSADSRADGGWQVPYDHIKGRAMFVWLSVGPGGAWPWGDSGIRFERFFRSVR